MLELDNIHKSYPLGPVRVEILKGVSLRIDSGELVSIVGKSGCGKSTLMNILGLLDTATTGRYILDGRETGSLTDRELSRIRNEKIGFVFQQFFLLSRLTAVENVSLPLVYRGVAEKERRETAREMLDKVGMGDREKHRPMELSGGQQQRVAIARAMAARPAIILADEPTGALDTAVGQSIMELFSELNQTQGITTLIITHDPNIARQCGRMIRMQDGVVAEAEASSVAGRGKSISADAGR
ncbi:MAG: ABC transporter ATP-binding protein [Desulfobacteraceae bacterium]|nr:MAG: ABC transporter ATP-binding protein [Desulfobacteraceae bacterium]